jgi:O-antigen/teichoic acid export membrane protein
VSDTVPRRVARNAAVRMAGEIIAKIGSLAFFVTMARELGAHGFGEFQFAAALTGALTFIAGFGTDELIAREVARAHGRAPRLLADAAAVKLLGGLAMLAVAVAIVNVGNYTAEGRAAVYIVGAGSLLEVLSKSWFGVFQGYERFELISATLIFQRLLTAAVGIAVLLSGGGVVAACLVYAGGSLAAVAFAEVLLRRLGVHRARVDRAGWVPIVRAGIPIGLIGLLLILLLRLDVTMLSFLSDAATVGIYAVAYRLVEATQFIGSAMAMATLPWLARTAMGVARGYRLGLKAVTAVLLPIGLGFILFADPIVDTLYGRAFAGSVLPLQLLGMGSLLYGLNAFAAATLIARDRPGAYTKAIAPVILLNVGLNLILIPRHGAAGAAFTALVSSTALAALGLWQARRVVGPADLIGAFSGPVLAGMAMAGAVLALPAPWLAEMALAALVYLGVLGGFEWLTRREDARVYLTVLPWSRSPVDRTTA